MLQGDKKYIRVSFQAFNTIEDIDYLVDALKKIASNEKLLKI